MRIGRRCLRFYLVILVSNAEAPPQGRHVKFHQTRLHHSGVLESAIGAMPAVAMDWKRCRDRSELGFERYFGLAVLGRKFTTLANC